jgi:uncharacterized damage-inducible protein DinB
MFTTPQEAIAFSLRSSKAMLHRFLDDLKPEEFQHRPCLGANSAAWIVGHLTSIDRGQLERLGVENLPEVPAGFKERFATTRAAATGTQADFGQPEDLIRLFDRHRDLLIDNVHRIPASDLAAPPAMPSPLFSDRGESLLFLGMHTAMHMGQLTIIRRSLGRPPLA